MLTRHGDVLLLMNFIGDIVVIFAVFVRKELVF
jgi:hypothetical protein